VEEGGGSEVGNLFYSDISVSCYYRRSRVFLMSKLGCFVDLACFYSVTDENVFS
jgi:hypothetical protein